MNILVIVELYFHKNKSGGEGYLHYFLKKIKNYTDAKIEVLLPSSKEDKRYEFENILINETIESIEDCKGYIENSDLVITQLMLSPEVIKMSLDLEKNVIWILHGYFEGFNKLMKDDRIIKIFNSKNVLNDFSNKSQYRIENYHIIYPFTDFPTLSKNKDVEKERREYISFINPIRNKGAELILKLARKNPSRKFLIVEGGYAKMEQKGYLEQFRQLTNTHIIKNTNDIVNDIFLKSRIVIMASKYESYGMCASEATCFEIPVIINKNTKGLVENLGNLSLGGKDENLESYQRIIESLDIEENYYIWSKYYYEHAEERYNEIEYQYEKFLNQHFKQQDED